MEGNSKRRISGEVKSYGLSKQSPEPLSSKVKAKGFGFAGFKFRKVDTTAEKRSLHVGEVNEKTKSSKHMEDVTEEMSPETLNALDWMLRNITRIKEQGESAFRRALSSVDSSVNEENMLADQVISTTEKAEIVVPVRKNTRPTAIKSQKQTKVCNDDFFLIDLKILSKHCSTSSLNLSYHYLMIN
ncbi:hypothetical protein DICVIV_01410 [Dictyocaulus viviparus]|uniref:Uncharacterized protein n=1 Tax=Dictyocaulus viviparus TaxID=29172 RepID=A0A0D8Y6F1_DICVI|nr:hypothetical protein DICVIV_01410 [Dictyocaulus viviparus]